MKRVLLFLIFSFTLLLTANKLYSSTNYGFELDLLPYLTGGYYGSIWIGVDNIRIRPVIAKVNTPSFMINSGFNSLQTKAYAFIIDFFPCKKAEDKNFEGLWIGTGFEYWNNNIKRNEFPDASTFRTVMFTLGLGYIVTIYKSFYINPWAGMHIKVSGSNSVPVSGASYDPKKITPELSMKLGFEF